ncbi:putative gamma-glutamylcyclotransferase [Frankia sp. AgKG'84/4]
MARAAWPTADLFVYGTLMFPAVVSTLIGRVPAMEPAHARGWRPAPLRDRVYPGLVRGEGGDPAAAGRVLRGLTAQERTVFDAFEGAAYEAGPLALGDGRAAVAYLWLDPAEVLAGTWDVGRFAERDLDSYVRRCAAWRARLAYPAS